MRKEVAQGEPGSTMGIRSLLFNFTDTNKDKVVGKAEWDVDDAMVADKFNADRFVGIRPGGGVDPRAVGNQPGSLGNALASQACLAEDTSAAALQLPVSNATMNGCLNP